MKSRILVLTSGKGVESVELTEPWNALEARGAALAHIAPRGSTGLVDGDLTEAGSRVPDVILGYRAATTLVADFEMLYIPGGTVNADQLRIDRDAVELVRVFASAGRPIASICHGPWVLVEAGLVVGKDLTSFPSLRTDVVNAGGLWHDRAPVICTRRGWTLVTARNPGDLDEFSEAMCDVLGL